ncbi:hypothetical protein SERLA73DRAFT_161207 [Serpula lacrymans var. lacrymans S7.3]|uniref:Uncharacterized protein n=2 Tax=Serpula lacrymans var. lacrymans TaxID=341189 RepID=F8PZW1_SERL3|nr:uncharacterized protein SERLADRAFT_470628 [Serpula lacrymans var. lacrymans S7.9]EGN98433.1 hypothetical protein SERLA73DRAFT_161207 [Serpula lacrymans var. lacrymans S7.3]EGO24013.1 hypothetical protein SERLADRAFT_470628 [Serpula lacrymans var. lacrymans S7.9]
MAAQIPRNVPLAGKPPFATDDPDSLFDQPPQQQRRIRQPAEPNPNNRSSAYNMYDQYLNGDDNRQSGLDYLGLNKLGMMADHDNDYEDANPFNSKHDKHAALAAATHPKQPAPIPLAAPRPGYPAPIAALNLSRPSPAATPEGRMPAHPQMSQVSPALRGDDLFADSPRLPPPAYSASSNLASVPNTPHPLQPPMTPITPVFARPSKSPAPRDVKFAPGGVIRGNSEDVLIPKRGERGDDFWRRFSMVAKEENQKPTSQKQSPWLRKTQNGTTRLSRWVWFIAVVLLLCIAAGVAIGWRISHNTPPNQAPKAFGGSANESAPGSSAAGPTSSALHVSPTYTVERRAVFDAVPTGTFFPKQLPGTSNSSARLSRKHIKRHIHH